MEVEEGELITRAECLEKLEEWGSYVEGLLCNLEKKLESKMNVMELHIKSLEHRIDNLESDYNKNVVVITGLCEDNIEDMSATLAKVIATLKAHLDINVDELQIDKCHRLGEFKNKSERDVYVRFSSYYKKQEILLMRKKLRGSGISIREKLTAKKLQILKGANAAYGCKNVWSFNGEVFALINDERIKLT